MIIKGGSRGGAGNLAAHILRTDQNERVRIIEIAGLCAATVPQALSEMAALAAGSRATRPLYHVSISPDPKEPPLTRAQWDRAIQLLEERLGLQGCARVVLEHEKGGRIHRHVVWSRVDPRTGKICSDSLNWQVHSEVGRMLEEEFGHRRTHRAHARAEGEARPRRNPRDWEEQQHARTGVDPRQVKREVTAIWRSSDSGRAFQAGRRAAGYILARGDKREALVLVDRAGGVHGLLRRLDGVKAAELKARLADLNLATLPTVQEARASLRSTGTATAARSPQEVKTRRPRVSVHPGRLPVPATLRGPKSPRGSTGALIVAGSGARQPEPPPKLKPVVSVFVPQLAEGPGLNPFEVLDAIDQLKRALAAGAEVGESLRRMEQLYYRLMFQI